MLYLEVSQEIEFGWVIQTRGNDILVASVELPPENVVTVSPSYHVVSYVRSSRLVEQDLSCFLVALTLDRPYTDYAQIRTCRFGFFFSPLTFNIEDTQIDIWTDKMFTIPVGRLRVQVHGDPFDFDCYSVTRISFTHYVLKGAKCV